MRPSAFKELEHWYEATLHSLDSNPSKSQNNYSRLLHVYKTVFHGFSASLTSQQSQQLEKLPEVVAVFPDRLLKLHTTRSPYFLGLYEDTNNTVARPLLVESNSGSNVIIGFLDSGIWPEHPSFDDKGLDPLPAGTWKGECVEADMCNNKIIGARFFLDGYEAWKGGRVDRSPWDNFGHGTHTASIAAGRAVEGSSFSGYANGTAIGVAPKARIAVYKVCGDDGCAGSDVLAGFDKAVEDGVDIISISLGGEGAVPYDEDPIAIAAFGAMEKGVSVISSAGNSGPFLYRVSNVAPWMTTVAAGTIDRGFLADLVPEYGPVMYGASLYGGPPLYPTFLPLAYGGSCSEEGLPDESFSGKIVVCDAVKGTSAIAQEDVVRNILHGSGVVVANLKLAGKGRIAKPFSIPGLTITESDGNTIRDLIRKQNTNTNATIIFRGTDFGIGPGIEPAPAVAYFSSRGPNSKSSYVLKPDVVAPGVNILGAWIHGKFNVTSGTSMACPHVSGLAALLKGAHKDWSPAMIRSAIMTTAYTQANNGEPIINENDGTESKASDMGSGHIDPEKARDPGLVYDITPNDYAAFLCASNYTVDQIRLITNESYATEDCSRINAWDLNYPAISIDLETLDYMNRDITVKRTVTRVGDGDASYSVTVTNPKGVTLTVNPMKMDFTAGKGEKQSYAVTITATSLPKETVEGKIVWSDGKQQVVSPVVIRAY
ncbi:Subtilase family protein [Striga hermonthica]|uniref:Subtilase family protein n=1 Tax=Striga hermonthica TaxID=68872 RepID=A0A9N7RG82_STRHE|nr:Subtilase family protein [Striga hermonthica]